MLPRVIIYTDGSCDKYGNGGWAASIYWNGKGFHISGGEEVTTNNRMELSAVIEALDHLEPKCLVLLYSDSRYVVDGMNKYISKWKKRNWRTADGKPVSNRDLWEKLTVLLKKHNVVAEWVKGHSGNPGNEIVDKLASHARPKKRKYHKRHKFKFS